MKTKSFLYLIPLLVLSGCSNSSNKNEYENVNDMPESFYKCAAEEYEFVEMDGWQDRVSLMKDKWPGTNLICDAYLGTFDGYDVFFQIGDENASMHMKIGEYWFYWHMFFKLTTYNEETNIFEWLKFVVEDGCISSESLESIYHQFRGLFKYLYPSAEESDLLTRWSNYCEYNSPYFEGRDSGELLQRLNLSGKE